MEHGFRGVRQDQHSLALGIRQLDAVNKFGTATCITRVLGKAAHHFAFYFPGAAYLSGR